ncbi:30S ribosomal protein S3 [Candidatus Woesearchaeota archaeon]|nr:30S ribosomal protein S3 [Candidatus Woesearchaeota archaeon]
MIEREFVEQKKKEFQIQEFVSETLKNAGHSHTKLQRTPLGEKVVIYTSRPGLIVGRKGQTISKLTEVLKKKFGLENPQVEIAEVSNPSLDSRIVAEKIASDLERFGSNRFKGIMHKASEDVLAAGAIGVEIRLSGKLPGARAKSWRVAGGYLRKCGDAAMSFVDTTIHAALLKPGVIGIQVRIMPSGIVMPDEIKMVEEEKAAVGPVVEVAEGAAVAAAEPGQAAVIEAVVAAEGKSEVAVVAETEAKGKAPKKRKSPSRAKPKAKKAEAVTDAAVKAEEPVANPESKDGKQESEVKDEGNEGS